MASAALLQRKSENRVIFSQIPAAITLPVTHIVFMYS